LTPPHPSSTLFPYTTLFRSISKPFSSSFLAHRLQSAHVADERHALSRRNSNRQPRRRDAAGAARARGGRLGRVRGHAADARDQVDRKSTRLNSSHSQISYAV